MTNAGPVAATTTSLQVRLPPQVKLAHAVVTSGTCTGSPVITCSLGGLAVSATDLVVLTLTGVKPGTGRISASVSGQPADGSGVNNAGSLKVSVPKPAPKPKR